MKKFYGLPTLLETILFFSYPSSLLSARWEEPLPWNLLVTGLKCWGGLEREE